MKIESEADMQMLLKLSPETIDELFIFHSYEGALPDFKKYINLRKLHITNPINDSNFFNEICNLSIEDLCVDVKFCPSSINLPQLKKLFFNFSKDDLTQIEFAFIDDVYIDFSGCSLLEDATIRYFHNLDLTGFKENKNLIKLAIVGGGARNIEALHNLPKLKKLILPENGLSDISGIERLKQIRYLDLSYNMISDCSLLYEQSYDFISLYQNPLLNDEVRTHLKGEEIIIDKRDKYLSDARKNIDQMYDMQMHLLSQQIENMLHSKDSIIRKRAEQVIRNGIKRMVCNSIENIFPGVLKTVPEMQEYMAEYAKKRYPFLKDEDLLSAKF